MTLVWAAKLGIRIDFIQSGQSQQNAYVERYNRTLRYDWLAHHLFETLENTQDFATRWLWAYNHDHAQHGAWRHYAEIEACLGRLTSTFSVF